MSFLRKFLPNLKIRYVLYRLCAERQQSQQGTKAHHFFGLTRNLVLNSSQKLTKWDISNCSRKRIVHVRVAGYKL